MLITWREYSLLQEQQPMDDSVDILKRDFDVALPRALRARNTESQWPNVKFPTVGNLNTQPAHRIVQDYGSRKQPTTPSPGAKGAPNTNLGQWPGKLASQNQSRPEGPPHMGETEYYMYTYIHKCPNPTYWLCCR